MSERPFPCTRGPEPTPTSAVTEGTELELWAALAVVGTLDFRADEAMGVILESLGSQASLVPELADVPEQDRDDIINVVALRLMKARPGTGARCVETVDGAEAYLRRALRNGAIDVFRRQRSGAPYDENRLGDPDPPRNSAAVSTEQLEAFEREELPLSRGAVAFVFGVIAKRSILSMMERFRSGRRQAFAQMRDILDGRYQDLLGLAQHESTRTGKTTETTYAALQKSHKRAKHGLERAGRQVLASEGVPANLQAEVDRVLVAMGCLPICQLWPAERLVFDLLGPRAVELCMGEVRRGVVAAGLDDLARLHRREITQPELVSALMSDEGNARSEAKSRIDKRQDMARRALGRAVDAALVAEDIQLGDDALGLDVLLDALGLGPLLHLHLARSAIFEPLDASVERSLGAHRTAAGELLRVSRREVTVEDLARLEAASSGVSFVDALLALKASHHAALMQLQRWLLCSLERGGVAPVLEPHVDRLLAELGGPTVCLQWRADRLIFRDLASTVIRHAKRCERDDCQSLDALAWIEENTLLLKWMISGLRRVARGEAQLEELVVELAALPDQHGRCWPYGNHRGALAWTVGLLEQRCTARLHQIRRDLHPAIDGVFVRIGGSRVCDAWAARPSPAGGPGVSSAH